MKKLTIRFEHFFSEIMENLPNFTPQTLVFHRGTEEYENMPINMEPHYYLRYFENLSQS